VAYGSKKIATLGVVLAAGCQTVLGDFTIGEAPPEPPPSLLGTACEPGSYRCTNELLETCNDERTGFVVAEVCASAAECNLNSHRCRPCIDGERMCRENILERCDGNAQWLPDSTCDSAALCGVAADYQSGSCSPALCETPGQHRCDAAKLTRCSAGRERYDTVALCETPELCDAEYADELAAAGERGACRPPACEPDAWSCVGRTLRHCAVDRTAWDEVATCESEALCNVELGACAACEPGSVVCNGAELRRCTASGTWKTLELCKTDALCDVATESCHPAECNEPGALRCASRDGVPGLERCSEALTWEVAEVCAHLALCNLAAGECLPPACVSGETRCVGNRHEHCSADRTHFELTTTCAEGMVCDATRGCEPGPCLDGTVRCNGASLERCASARFEEIERCATPALCNAETASCAPPVCPPIPAFECRGTTIIQRCRPGRDMFDDFRTCTVGVCDPTPGLVTGLPECDVCTPNAYECDGLVLKRCSSDGQRLETMRTCATECGVGLPPTCL